MNLHNNNHLASQQPFNQLTKYGFEEKLMDLESLLAAKAERMGANASMEILNPHPIFFFVTLGLCKESKGVKEKK